MRIVDGFKRILSATIFFGTEDQPAGMPRFHFSMWSERSSGRR